MLQGDYKDEIPLLYTAIIELVEPGLVTLQ